MKIQSIRGTHDILPGTVELWQKVEQTARRLFALYGYAEVRTPVMEETELFRRTIGSQTDIVQKEMYTFADSKGKKISLRPEGTAPVVRAYLEHALYHDKVTKKLYYVGPMFRHERPQKGRYRQFHQIGAEVLGTDHPAVEAEVVEMLGWLFSEVGVNGLRLLINSVGCARCRPPYIRLLRGELEKHQAEFCSECRQRAQSNPLRVFDCKLQACQPAIDKLPTILDHICEECCQHFDKFQRYLEASPLSRSMPSAVEPRLVRGLDYYVRTTFEMISPDLGPTQNAVAGGGRYDGLSEMVGGPSTQGFGFALGMERLVLLLTGQKEMPQTYRTPAPDVFLVYMQESYLEEGLRLARELRSEGVFAYIDFESRSFKAQMRLANRMAARFVCIIGEKELESGQFPVKRMEDGTQVALTLEAIAEHVRT